MLLFSVLLGLRDRDDLSTRDKIVGPIVSLVRRFHWILMSTCVRNVIVLPSLYNMQAGAFRSHSKKILDPSAIHITVDVFDHVTFKNRTVFITQRNGSVMEFPGIHKFHLSNRLVNDSVFRFSAPGRYHGYGEGNPGLQCNL